MVISIQDYLARRQDAAAARQTRLAAIGRSRIRGATLGPGLQRTAVATMLAADRQSVPAWSVDAFPDLMTLYAEATLL